MPGFGGFAEVGKRLKDEQRARMTTVVMRVDAYDFLVSREFVSGHDLIGGGIIRATLADRRTYDGRSTLADVREQYGEGCILVLSDCVRNRLGTFEARKVTPFVSESLVVTSGLASVTKARQHEDGRWVQTIQHLATDRSALCKDFRHLVDEVLASLDAGEGRSGAMVRGWHGGSRRASVMAFDVTRTWDRHAKRFHDAEASLDAFLAAESIYIAGVNATATGEQCLGEVERLMGSHPHDIVWEVIPKQSYGLGGVAAEEAGLRVRRDPSEAYRITSDQTGYLPSVIGFTERDDVLWPRLVAPIRMGIEPSPAAYVPTAHAVPGAPVRSHGSPGRAATAQAAVEDCSPPMPPDLDVSYAENTETSRAKI